MSAEKLAVEILVHSPLYWMWSLEDRFQMMLDLVEVINLCNLDNM